MRGPKFAFIARIGLQRFEIGESRVHGSACGRSVTPLTRAQYGLLWVACACLPVLALSTLRCSSPPRALLAKKAANEFPPAADRKLYGQTVVVPDDAKGTLRDAALDLAARLQSGTGVSFQIAARASRGIFLMRSDSPEAPPEAVNQLKAAGREAYWARSNGDGRLLIVANAEDGLIFGAYQYLERLGFRFYFPSEAWTIVPRLRDIELPLDLLAKPAFRVRGFVGTGGFGAGLAIDPAGKLSKRWASWKVANGFGAEFRVGGHIGEAFNTQHKATLLAHPEYLASVDGKRAWSKGAKLDPSNPAAVDLFVRDRVAAYRAQKARDPDGPSSFAVSVEPADGALDCNSAACQKIGGPSEQEFFLANAVAKALAKEFPGAKASLLAYNKHADVPRIDIEPNVYVTIVPYAFRAGSSRSAEAFIDDWSKKKSPLSLYDYWSIPDWTADLPEFDYRSAGPKKIRFWFDHGIEGAGVETSYSAGAMGLALYMAGHLMWQPTRDPAALADEFFRDCFASAALPMRRMLERWANGFLLTKAELHASFTDLAEALKRADSPAVTARLVDYAGYLQYLRLRYEFSLADAAQRPASKRALLRHIWSVYDSAMLHAFRLHQLLLRGEPELSAEFGVQNGALPIWKAVSPLRETDARELVARGLRDYAYVDMALKSYGGELVYAERAPNGDVAAGAVSTTTSVTLAGDGRLELSIPEGVHELQIQLRSSTAFKAVVSGADGRELVSAEYEAGTQHVLAAPIESAGSYQLEIHAPKLSKTTVAAPPEVGVELQELRIPKPAPVDLYFFVPRGETHVSLYNRAAFQLGGPNPPALFDASGKPASATLSDGDRIMTATVPAGQDGKVWMLRGAVAPLAPLKLLNAPQRFALSRSALRVPAGALLTKPSSPLRAAPASSSH
jgi:uncharacterized protein DUF4838